MIINTTQIELALLGDSIPAYSIEKATGVSRSTIGKLRSGEIKLENVTLKNLMLVQQWIDDGNFRIGYDYEELIQELEGDIEEGLAKDYIYIVRGEFLEAINACPIIDYYYEPEDIEDGDMAERVRTLGVLEEMKRLTELF